MASAVVGFLPPESAEPEYSYWSCCTAGKLEHGELTLHQQIRVLHLEEISIIMSELFIKSGMSLPSSLINFINRTNYFIV